MYDPRRRGGISPPHPSRTVCWYDGGFSCTARGNRTPWYNARHRAPPTPSDSPAGVVGRWLRLRSRVSSRASQTTSRARVVMCWYAPSPPASAHPRRTTPPPAPEAWIHGGRKGSCHPRIALSYASTADVKCGAGGGVRARRGGLGVRVPRWCVHGDPPGAHPLHHHPQHPLPPRAGEIRVPSGFGRRVQQGLSTKCSTNRNLSSQTRWRHLRAQHLKFVRSNGSACRDQRLDLPRVRASGSDVLTAGLSW
jgi:hypothetical protein